MTSGTPTPSSGPRKPRVLVVSFNHLPGHNGQACWLLEQIRFLAQLFDVDVLSLKNDELAHIERFHGARLLRVPIGEGSLFNQLRTFQRAIHRQLESDAYQVCHFTSLWEGMVLGGRKSELKLKLVYDLMQISSMDFPILYPQEFAEMEHSISLTDQEARCFAVADKILVPTAVMQTHLMERKVPAGKVVLAPPSLNLYQFPADLQVAPEPNTIVYLGNLLPWQGLPALLNASAELARKISLRLLLVCPAEGPWARELAGKIQMFGLERTVERIDPLPQDQLAKTVQRAQVCVAPLASHEHNRLAGGIPHKILVYMACGRPVVAARHPILEGVVEHLGTGLLYTPGDTPALTSALYKLLLDHDLSKQLGNQARQHLQRRFSYYNAMARLLDVYRDLLGMPVSMPLPKPNDMNVYNPPSRDFLPEDKIATRPDISGMPDTSPNFAPAKTHPPLPKNHSTEPNGETWKVQRLAETNLESLATQSYPVVSTTNLANPHTSGEDDEITTEVPRGSNGLA